MTKQNKIDLVSHLSSSFLDTNIIICGYKGLSVKDLEILRRDSIKCNAKVQVIKNKLANIAFKNANINGVSLKDTNIFIWSKDQISLSKSVQKFADNNKDKFIIKLGFFDGIIVDSKHIESVSKLPNKEELIGMLLSVWSAPARYFVTGLDNLRKQKEAS
ncbi:50S ribosomal protein L10 [Helicobacter sp. MIT 14-3879]|uniref:50S ribosomal protein L10 n=1 Tax=Helicobacter sp. MIT 14-3879 TaxID=2040649 RepID=UPI000E1F3DC3|nr:50S ribosomal protein L10 [Helicobacter sp. MIT 14-3879]RDU63506.1 50S ribosomal protein L10 [Helicobacter sp. MIT 14-3879]